MTAQQGRFVEEYCKHQNGTKAAIAAKYSEKTARQIAYKLLQNPDIVQAIKERYESLGMSAEEAIKRVSDNAATRLNDYIRVDEVWETPMVKKHLSVLIAELQMEVDIEEEVADRIGLFDGNGEASDKSDKKLTAAQDEFFLEQAKRKTQIVRYQVELEMNPNAYRFVKGEPVLIERPGVDLVKLSKADEKGLIKKLSFNERGLPSVEMASAEGALETILKIHGKLTQKIEVNTPPSQVDTSNLSEEQKAALLAVARNMK